MGAYLIAGAIALATVAAIWRGFVLSVVWSWFITDRFGAPALSVAQAIGLTLVVTMLTHRFRPASETKGHSGEAVADMLFQPLLVLAVAWIVRGFL